MDTETGESSKTVSAQNQPDKLKVLCLHGYKQSGDTFRSKLGSFRKHVNKYAELVFITAPHTVKSLPNVAGSSSDNTAGQYSWWFNADDETFKGTNIYGPALGFQESLAVVEKAWQEQGPFQGLLGFSQGACFVGLLCGLSAKSFTRISPQFVVLASGFRSGSLVHKNFYEDSVNIPALHIFGETDEIIPRAMSELLLTGFENAEVLTHPGGHFFPASAQQKQTYINFFQDRLQEHLEIMELAKSDKVMTFSNDSASEDSASVEENSSDAS